MNIHTILVDYICIDFISGVKLRRLISEDGIDREVKSGMKNHYTVFFGN